jgi:glycosyltransferase involved in cell wall biosynthesis
MRSLYIVTTTFKTYEQFLIPIASRLSQKGISLSLLCNFGETKESKDYLNDLINVTFSRNLFHPGNIKAYFFLKKFFKDKKCVISVHTPIAAAITRLAVYKFQIKVIYTNHGYHFHKDSGMLSWLIFYPIEKYLSKFTYRTICINKQDFKITQERFYSRLIEYIPGIGLNLHPFRAVNDSYSLSLYEELNIPFDALIILSVGELNRNKNHKLILDYMNLTSTDDSVHFVVCGEGPLKSRYEQFTRKSKLSNRIHFLGQRKDVIRIMNQSSIFVFPSLREGLGLAFAEAVSQSMDVIAYNIRGIEEVIPISHQSKYLVQPYFVSDFYKLLDSKIKKWRMDCGERTNPDWIERFKVENVIDLHIHSLTDV